jgi:hypothetical protein
MARLWPKSSRPPGPDGRSTDAAEKIVDGGVLEQVATRAGEDLVLEQVPKPPAEQVMVVDEEDARAIPVRRAVDAVHALLSPPPPAPSGRPQNLAGSDDDRHRATAPRPRLGFDLDQRSMAAPCTGPPVSAATPSPYPGIERAAPSGITAGSTATVPTPAGSRGRVPCRCRPRRRPTRR